MIPDPRYSGKEKPHEPGFWGQTIKNASAKIMCLTANRCNKIILGMMTIAQYILGKDTPVNHEKMKSSLMISAGIKSVKYFTAGDFEALV